MSNWPSIKSVLRASTITTLILASVWGISAYTAAAANQSALSGNLDAKNASATVASQQDSSSAATTNPSQSLCALHSSLCAPETAPASKVPVRPVEPFFQEISSESQKIYQSQVTYLSPEKAAPMEFSSLGATWSQLLPEGTSIAIEVRLISHGKYSDWYPLEASIDQKDDTSDNNLASAFITTSLADGYQYRIALNSIYEDSTPVLDQLKFTFINGGSPQQKTNLLLAGRGYRAGHDTGVNSGTTASITSTQTDGEYLPDNFDPNAVIYKVRNPLSRPSADPSQYQVAATSATPSQNEEISQTAQLSQITQNQTALLAQAEALTTFTTRIRPPARPVRRTPSRSTSIPTAGSSNLTAGKLKIISRAQWGADESLRLYKPSANATEPKLVNFEDDYYTKYASELKESKRVTTDANGNLLTWPLSYPESIKKIVIHHTATTKNLENPQTAIRDIYIWHTLSKGWGDIGYNYIIDQQGNIYEGRYGGEMVVGAHAGRGNHGSIGIAVLGNFEDSDPPQAVIDSLTALIREKAALYHLDTEGATSFRGENFPNVMGHRDIMSTSCPGDKLYAMLPLIRKMAKVNNVTTAAPTVSKAYDFAWTDHVPVITVNPNTSKMLSFKLKNTGTSSWSPATYFQIRPDQNSHTFLRNSEKILSSTVGRTVAPGDSVDIQILTKSTATSGSTIVEIQPVIDGSQIVARYLGFGYQVKTPAPKPKYDYELLSVIYSKQELHAGDILGVTVRLRNKGTAPWQNSGSNKVDLGADKPRDHLNSLLLTPGTRLANMQETLVQSGQIATFNFQIRVPTATGLYKEYFTPVVEGIQWMNNHSSYLQVRVGDTNQTNSQELDPEGDTSITPSVVAPAKPPVSTPPATPSPALQSPSSPVSAPSAAPSTSVGSSNNIATTPLDLTAQLRPIRIDLSYRGNPATISGDGNFYMYEGVRKIASFRANELVSVEFRNSVFQVTSASGIWTVSSRPRFIPGTGTILRIDNWSRPSGLSSDNQFRGNLEVIYYKDELHVINELPLEDYLKGISEEPGSEPDEKIKAIMVIARTYARFYMEVARKFPGAPFDLTDSPLNSQKYTGYSFEKRSPRTVGFATATAGQVVTYQGKLIKTPFFSKSDGHSTISARDKWGWTDAPFLISVDDSVCKSNAFYGHGVGLSGCGATAMAKLGKTYDQIIKYYYQGTAITQTK